MAVDGRHRSPNMREHGLSDVVWDLLVNQPAFDKAITSEVFAS